jgi:plastocyanin
MRLRPGIALVAVLFAVVACGCGEERGKRSETNAKPRAAGPSAAGGIGSIRGTVSLRGQPPVMQDIPNQPCHAGATPVKDESVVADDGGRLANVVVFFREAPSGSAPSGGAAVELDQVNCRYVPHVLALRTGQLLRVKTSDPAVHNVHMASSANPARNDSMQPGAPPLEMTFAAAEEFAVRCDIHPWMNARVHVFEHGCFAVTDAAGSFAIEKVPAGQYTLVFRHELFGDIEETVTLNANQTLTHDATYEKPGN